MNPATVFIVGAGPGDPGLVTVKAKHLIETCDVLIYDYLVDVRMLEWTPPGCETIYVGKQPNHHVTPQKSIEALMIEKARQGLRVVRLKGGDPFVFGRGGEEASSLQQAGLSYEVVPGVTAGLGSAACTGIPLTHRDLSSSVCFLTGHEDPEKKVPLVDFQLFAKTQGTLCIYMGMGQLEFIVGELIAGGRTASTPVAVVEWATLPRQRSVTGTLETIVALVQNSHLQAPAMIIVGEVVQLESAINWYQNRPLYGKRIAITRTREQASELREQLERLGADVLELPLIRVSADTDSANVEEVFAGLATYEWLVFTSPNGVKYFFEVFFKKFKDLRCLGPARIACIGSATAKAVDSHRLEVDFIPTVSTAEAFGAEFIKANDVENQQVLVVTGNRNRKDLIEALEEKGRAIVDQLQVYKTEPNDLSDHPEAQRFCHEGAHAITFTSASTVQSFIDQARQLQIAGDAQRPKAISIGPVTSKAMQTKGLPVDAQAKESNMAGLITSIINKFSAESK